ncbi:JmjC domain-containing protein [Streptomyces sp. FH025]|uniref:JmjC domain-containing protein n=1 Tax=Streptomyces sp. FH025 TaxID=2815937 RepID=UPI001A9EFA2B|nr:cupin domain-containing protein [Streptomyces sp. FH025]MBO1416615.1 cupin-like domain-containing protein [Streptomyces sp. FH025]
MRYRALAKLVPSPEEFLSDPPTTPQVWSMPAGELAGLLDLEGTDELLRDGVSAADVRIVLGGREVPPADYTWGERSLEPSFAGHVRPGAVTGLLDQGATLVLDNIHRYWRPVGDFCRGLAHEVGTATTATAFLTPPGNTGFPYHFDERGNVLVQTVGSKTWRVREQPFPDPLPHETNHDNGPTAAQLERFAHEPAALEVTLHPGDVLWIPRGWLHSGTATDEPSVHVTIGFVPMLTRHWLAEQLVRHLGSRKGEFTGLRAELPWGLARDTGRLTEVTDEVRRELTEALARVDSAAFADGVARLVRGGYHEPHVAPVAAALGPAVDADTLVVLVPESLFDMVHGDGGRLRLDLADRSLTLQGPAARFLAARWGQGGQVPWCARDIPGVTEEAAVTLVRTLHRAGIVRRPAPERRGSPRDLPSHLPESVDPESGRSEP